jgi:Domain of Unknown Function (DUF1080)
VRKDLETTTRLPVSSRGRLLAVLLSLLVLSGYAATDAAPTDEAIQRLILQLGSDDFKEREAATEALKKIGEPALKALRAIGTTSKDAEVIARANRLVEDIEKTVPYQFNGKDLTGWVLDSGPKDAWQVVDGAIVTRGQGSDNRGWLLSERTWKDFVFKCQFQLGEGADGGVGLRAEGGEKIGRLPMHLAVKLRSRPFGQVQVGSFYYWVNIAEPPARPANLKQAGVWNDLVIELRGQKLRVVVNGQEIQDLDLDQIARREQVMPGVKRTVGRVGLQQHSGEVRFRDIRIKALTGAGEPGK